MALATEKIQCHTMDLGLIDYPTAYEVQLDCVTRAISTKEPTIILCEHFPVLTLGRMSHKENVLVSLENIERKRH